MTSKATTFRYACQVFEEEMFNKGIQTHPEQFVRLALAVDRRAMFDISEGQVLVLFSDNSTCTINPQGEDNVSTRH